MHTHVLRGELVHFDPRVHVIAPAIAEDAMNVPVAIVVNSLDRITAIVAFADLNPIQEILRFYPHEVTPYLAFRFKVEQSTPIRAAVKTADGVWHVGGQWLKASGGGCTAPSAARQGSGWEETLGQVKARRWSRPEGARLRFRVMHPMDTGLAAGIPAFYVRTLALQRGDEVLATLETFEPVSANPVFTLDLADSDLRPIRLTGADNNGNRIDRAINP